MTVAKESQDPTELNNNTYSEDIILPQSELWSDEPPGLFHSRCRHFMV